MPERSAEQIRMEIAAERQRLADDVAELRREAKIVIPVAAAVLVAVTVLSRTKAPPARRSCSGGCANSLTPHSTNPPPAPPPPHPNHSPRTTVAAPPALPGRLGDRQMRRPCLPPSRGAAGTAMMYAMEWALVLVSVEFLGVAAVSRRLVGTPITPAMLFVGFGLVRRAKGTRRDQPFQHGLGGARPGGGDAGAGPVQRRVPRRPRSSSPRRGRAAATARRWVCR